MTEFPEPSDLAEPDYDGGPIAWMATHPVAANILMVLLLCGGFVIGGQLKQQNWPEVVQPKIRVTMPYPGATPRDIEKGVLEALESTARRVEGTRDIESAALKGLARATVTFDISADPNQALSKLKAAIDRVASFPEAVEEPRFEIVDNRTSLISVYVYGATTRKELERRALEVRPKFQGLSAVADVRIEGVPRREIHVELSESDLEKYGLQPARVVRRIRQYNVSLPGGEIETNHGELYLTTTGLRRRKRQLADIPVIAGDEGSRVLLGDVADLTETFADTDHRLYFNGERAVRLDLFMADAAGPTETSDDVRQEMDSLAETLPGDVRLGVWDDDSRFFRARMRNLTENALLGFALILVLVGLFLKPRTGFWTALGLPVAYAGAVCAMPAVGSTINFVSIFALLLTLGIVVDDAIVVGDAIDQQAETTDSAVEAAIRGTRSVLKPLTFAVVTTAVAFTPTLFVPGPIGELLPDLGKVAILVFVFSLVECLFILPAHLGHSSSFELPGTALWRRLQSRVSSAVEAARDRAIVPFVKQTIRYRYLTLSVGAGLLVVAIGLIGAGIVKFSFMPGVSTVEVNMGVRMPIDTSLGSSKNIAERMAKAAIATDDELAPSQGILRAVVTEPGGGRAFPSSVPGSHLVNAHVELVSPEERDVTTREFAEAWESNFEPPPGIEAIRTTYATAQNRGPDLDLVLHHERMERLTEAASMLEERLGEHAAIGGVESGAQTRRTTLRIVPTPAGQAVGLTDRQIAEQLRSAFHGLEALRLQRGDHELEILVETRAHSRSTLHDLRDLLLRTPDGGTIPLRRAATVEKRETLARILRRNGERVVHVTAEVETPDETTASVMAELEDQLFPKLRERFPSLEISTGGSERQRRRVVSYLGTGYLVVLVVMFGLLAIALDSYLEPFLVVLAIPFGFVGALLGHMLLGFSLSLISLFGVVALTGIVVNDVVVMLYETRRHLQAQHPVDAIRKRSMQLFDALAEAVRLRFRPVVLTSLTTFFGVVPMIFDRAPSVQLLVPVAISLGFGVLFATAITLVLVPAAYLVFEDLRELGRTVAGWLAPGE